MNQPVFFLPCHEAEVSVLAHWVEELLLWECALEFHVLFVLGDGCVLVEGEGAAAEVAGKAFAAIFLLGEVPAEHLQHEGDLESLVVDLIEGKDFLEEEGIGSEEGVEGSAVEEGEGVEGFVEVHLAADVVHTQVQFFPADLGGLFIEVETALLMLADHLQQLLGIGFHLLRDCHLFEADVALQQVPGDGAEAEGGEQVGVELFVRGVEPQWQLVTSDQCEDSLQFVRHNDYKE